MKSCSLKKSLKQAILRAKVAQQTSRLRALHSVQTMIIREERRKNRSSLTSNMLIRLLSGAAEERQEAAAIYQQQGEVEMAQLEQNELTGIQEYLPPQMSEEAIGKIVAQIIRSINARSIVDASRVISIAKEEIGYHATGRTIAKVVRAQLNQLS